MRYKLKNGGKSRPKAFLGIDGAINAAATLAAAGMTTAATIKAANQQAKAVESSARTQAEAVKAQTANNTDLQRESMNFQRQINQENRQQQQDIQTSLQLLAGQQNMDNRFKATQQVAKYGGRPKRKKLSKISSNIPSYGGARMPFRVTDGGGAIPIQTDYAGYGLYELYGNDHDHYHKAPGGKYKSGVGVKFRDGSTIEGEGNQNTKQGELLYVTPYDNMFISKHDIKGFNPAEAVNEGMHPQYAFNVQQLLKSMYGINDDGSKVNNSSYKQMAKYGGHRRLKCGGRVKKGNGGFWQNHAGATYNAAGNLLGAGIAAIGNGIAGRKLSNAYNTAGNILADAYSQMKGIDLSEISRSDYVPAHIMAAITNVDTNVNPQLERIRRDAVAQTKQVNNSTMSSAARQQRLAGINDRSLQRASEQYAYKQNEDQKIQQSNAERIQQASAANAQLDAQANQEYAKSKLALMEYNNDIDNAKIAGAAQARADAMTQSSTAKATALQNSMNAIGSAIANTGQGFASSYEAVRKSDDAFANTYAGLGNEQQVNAALLRYERTGDDSYINSLLNSNSISDSERSALNRAKNNKNFNIKRRTLKVTPGNILSDYINNGNDSNYYA